MCYTFINANDFSLDIFNANEPLVIRGIASDWPLVKRASEDIQKISEYLLCYYENDRIIAFASKPEFGNKFTYGSNDNQMSFEQLESTLDLVLETISESIIVKLKEGIELSPKERAVVDMYKFYRKLASGKWKYSETFKSTLDPYYHELINYCNDNNNALREFEEEDD